MLSAQILALSLIPLLSGIVPDDRTISSPAHLLGVEDRVTEDFLIGTWKYSEDFFRWGLADKDKAKIKPFRGSAYMRVEKGGSMRMINLFRPADAHWELTQEGILIQDPKYPDRASQLLPVKKRDKDRIWIMLPFASGSTGIGMVRVQDDETSYSEHSIERSSAKQRRSYDRTESSPEWTRRNSGTSLPDPTPLDFPPSSRGIDY
ncbi:MAG: hypothetical protein HY912_08970 [Desulfomonile tiedjei]|uniref:Uncharacterized protein n=1 Tax=Desulfomonile tiedjei TaxID=2358 RepID=A0A9D6Z064_9BACT|nr:hypothetical protein [Desulfomonile tiedjei]